VSEEPQRLASEIRGTVERHDELSSDSMSQSHDPESLLEVSCEKPTVCIGQRYTKSPGNIKYRELIEAKQAEYLQSDIAKRQSIVDDIANQFIFQQDGAPFDDDWLHEKIRKALKDTRRLGKQRMNEDEEDDDSQYELSEHGANSFPTSLEQSTVDGNLRQRAGTVTRFEWRPRASETQPTVDQKDGSSYITSQSDDLESSLEVSFAENKPIVHFGRRFQCEPGNIKYRKFLLTKKHEYFRSDKASRSFIVDDIANQFHFLHEGLPVDVRRIRQKIHKAFGDHRLGGKRKRDIMEKSDRWHPRKSSPSRKQAPATVGLALHELDKKATATEKMIVYCGRRTSHAPGNVAYMSRISTFQCEYRAADSSRQEAIVDSFLQIFDFQRPGDVMMKSWQPASKVWVRGKIRKAFLETRCGAVGKQNAKL
jgi:hypothetical protein